MADAALFLAGVYGVTWALCLLVRGDLLAWLLPTVWSPTALALILAARTGGSAAVKHELGHLVWRRGLGLWIFLACAFPAAATITALLIARSAGDAAPFTTIRAIPSMVALQLATGALGEELGWRGFLLPRFQQRMPKPAAACSMAVLWSLWHVAGMFFPGTPLQIVPAGWFLLNAACFGIFLAFLFDRAGESVLAPMAAHLALNVSLGVGGVRPSSVTFWKALAGMYGIAALSGAVGLRTPAAPFRNALRRSS